MEPDGRASRRRAELEARAEVAVERDVGSGDIAAGAERDDLGLGAGGHGDHPRVGGVQHGRARRGERLDQLTLGQRHAVEVAEEFGVGSADREHHTHGRVGDVAELSDVADASRSHLDDHGLGVIGRVCQRERHAEFVVERPDAGVRRAIGAEYRGEQVLGGGLADRPRHTDDRVGHASPRVAAQRLQRRGGVVDDHVGTGDSGARRQRGGSAGCDRGRDELVAIALGDDRHEEHGPVDLARVDRDSVHRDVVADEAASGRSRDFLQVESHRLQCAIALPRPGRRSTGLGRSQV